ncbi:archease [Candidatus Woesearchaeota archaeon]|nr:archease [Candidatus Woesearchaeota archaeon]
MVKFKFLEHTADARFEAYGKDLNGLFENSGLALEEIQVNTKNVEPKEEKTIQIENESIEMLLFDFLQELIYLKDAEKLIFSKFKVSITRNGKYFLNVVCKGDKLDFKKHEFKVDAKAVTLHQYEVKKEKGKWIARVIIDI